MPYFFQVDDAKLRILFLCTKFFFNFFLNIFYFVDFQIVTKYKFQTFIEIQIYYLIY